MIDASDITRLRGLVELHRNKEADRFSGALSETIKSTPDWRGNSHQYLAHQADRLVTAGEWELAYALYDILLQEGQRHYEWIHQKLLWRLTNRLEFATQFGAIAHQARVASHFEKLLGDKVAEVSTAAKPMGFVALAIFKHRIVFQNGRLLEVIEKVLSNVAGDIDRVARVDKLFTSMEAGSLFAPDYFGTIICNPFRSILFRHIEGVPLALSEYNRTVTDLLHAYWSLPPSPALSGRWTLVGEYVDCLKSIAEQKDAQILAAYITPAFAEDAARIVGDHLAAATDLIRRLPQFVFHADIHCENILVSGTGERKVIDWDGWVLAPIGTGCWPEWITETYLDVEKVRLQRGLGVDTTEAHLLLMGALWSYREGKRTAKFKRAASSLKRIVEHMRAL